MTSLTTFEPPVFFHAISLVNTGIITNIFVEFCTHIMEANLMYCVKDNDALYCTCAGNRAKIDSEMLSAYFNYSRHWKVGRILSRETYGIASRSELDSFRAAMASVSMKEKEVAEA